MDGLNLVITITDRDKTETAIKLFQECNVFTTDIVLGQGTAPREILEYLYLSPAEKSILRCCHPCGSERAAQASETEDVYRYSRQRHCGDCTAEQHRAASAVWSTCWTDRRWKRTRAWKRQKG